jgi:hypothetical protein
MYFKMGSSDGFVSHTHKPSGPMKAMEFIFCLSFTRMTTLLGVSSDIGGAIAQVDFSERRPRFNPRTDHVRFFVDKVIVG